MDAMTSGDDLRDAARLARECKVMGRAVTLARWIGTGPRQVTAGQVLRMLDWLAANRRLLSMQRLRNLIGRFPVDARLVSAVIAWAGEPPTTQWLKSQRVTSQVPATVPVFSPDVLGFIGEPDLTFAEYGYIRPAPPEAVNQESQT